MPTPEPRALTDQERAILGTERAKAVLREDVPTHEQCLKDNTCRACGGVGHQAWDCKVVHCTYCRKCDEHRKEDWDTGKLTCPMLIAK